jgi:hypothetical protein
MIQRGSLMLSPLLAWHIVWFTRVTLSFVLLALLFRRRLYSQLPLFALHTFWIAVAGATLIAMNYAPSVNGNQYFVGVSISNSVEAILAFAIIYQIFVQRVSQYPRLKQSGNSAFQMATLLLVFSVVFLAWVAPAPGTTLMTFIYNLTNRTIRTVQCGQLLFFFVFCGYFRLSWRSRAFSIALGLSILSGSSLAINAIRAYLGSTSWNSREYVLLLVNELTYLLSLAVWLFYLLAPARQPPAGQDGLPQHDLETWNQELEGMLEP